MGATRNVSIKWSKIISDMQVYKIMDNVLEAMNMENIGLGRKRNLTVILRAKMIPGKCVEEIMKIASLN